MSFRAKTDLNPDIAIQNQQTGHLDITNRLLPNTAKDGSGSYYSPLLDNDGKFIVVADETLDTNHILNNQVIGTGAIFTTSAIEFKKRSQILIIGTSNLNNINITVEVSPETSNPTIFLETFENVTVNSNIVYSYINLYTDYFRLKITNNEASDVTLNLYATSKN